MTNELTAATTRDLESACIAFKAELSRAEATIKRLSAPPTMQEVDAAFWAFNNTGAESALQGFINRRKGGQSS